LVWTAMRIRRYGGVGFGPVQMDGIRMDSHTPSAGQDGMRIVTDVHR
jgi:hypothetical protein